MATINKGFIKDWSDNILLPITRGELVLDSNGMIAFHSKQFEATSERYGLMSPAEKAMLTGNLGEGGNISDLYNKIDYINNGLKVGNTVLHYYNSNNESTPITFAVSAPLSIATENNIITFGLPALTTDGISESDIVKGITIDKYGRVTSVTAGKLQNADIPTELLNKKLTGCTTEAVGTNEYAIVNKSYVDSRITEITGVATGALKFGGVIKEETKDTTLAQSYENHYFKVIESFILKASLLHETNGIKNDLQVKSGDTLIVYQQKYIYIPSGDEPITSITVKTENTTALEQTIGDITLHFSDIFSVVNPTEGSKVALISIPPASESTPGYLSVEDYKKFNSYASTLAITYTPTITSGSLGSYKIGTLNIKGVNEIIYGVNNISSLVLSDGTVDQNNPILTFSETGDTGTDLETITTNITYSGGNGISVQKESGKNNIIFTSKNEVLPDYGDYLQILNNYQFGIKLGKLNNDNTITEGLVNFSTIHALALQVATTSRFEIIENSLRTEDESKQYYYGSSDLKLAVNVEI